MKALKKIKSLDKITSILILVVIGLGLYFIWLNFYNGSAIKLYFARNDGMGLQVEKRPVKGDSKEEAIKALIAGPENKNLAPTLPEGVKLLSLKVRDDGLCLVNFNESLVENHWGGSTGELLTVYSIVNTLTQFPDVDRVQILIEGRKLDTLAGHLILNESLKTNEKIVK